MKQLKYAGDKVIILQNRGGQVKFYSIREATLTVFFPSQNKEANDIAKRPQENDITKLLNLKLAQFPPISPVSTIPQNSPSNPNSNHKCGGAGRRRWFGLFVSNWACN